MAANGVQKGQIGLIATLSVHFVVCFFFLMFVSCLEKRMREGVELNIRTWKGNWMRVFIKAMVRELGR